MPFFRSPPGTRAFREASSGKLIRALRQLSSARFSRDTALFWFSTRGTRLYLPSSSPACQSLGPLGRVTASLSRSQASLSPPACQRIRPPGREAPSQHRRKYMPFFGLLEDRTSRPGNREIKYEPRHSLFPACQRIRPPGREAPTQHRNKSIPFPGLPEVLTSRPGTSDSTS